MSEREPVEDGEPVEPKLGRGLIDGPPPGEYKLVPAKDGYQLVIEWRKRSVLDSGRGK